MPMSQRLTPIKGRFEEEAGAIVAPIPADGVPDAISAVARKAITHETCARTRMRYRSPECRSWINESATKANALMIQNCHKL